MATLSVRKLDTAAKQALRERAAKKGVSMEQAARARLGKSSPKHAPKSSADGKPKWRLKATKEEILATLQGLPKVDFDQKEFTDKLYGYLEEGK